MRPPHILRVMGCGSNTETASLPYILKVMDFGSNNESATHIKGYGLVQ